MKLEDLKVGDAVAVLGLLPSPQKHYVTRSIKTLISVAHWQFRRRTGRQRGHRRECWIEPWTAEHDKLVIEQKEENRLRGSRRKLDTFPWHKINQDQADAVLSTMANAGMLEGNKDV